MRQGSHQKSMRCAAQMPDFNAGQPATIPENLRGERGSDASSRTESEAHPDSAMDLNNLGSARS
jgi:hypothetical protein